MREDLVGTVLCSLSLSSFFPPPPSHFSFPIFPSPPSLSSSFPHLLTSPHTVVDDDDHHRITAGAVVTVTVTLKRKGLSVCMTTKPTLTVGFMIASCWPPAGVLWAVTGSAVG